MKLFVVTFAKIFIYLLLITMITVGLSLMVASWSLLPSGALNIAGRYLAGFVMSLIGISVIIRLSVEKIAFFRIVILVTLLLVFTTIAVIGFCAMIFGLTFFFAGAALKGLLFFFGGLALFAAGITGMVLTFSSQYWFD